MADNMTPEQRRMTMSRIRGRDTKVELAVRKELHRRGYRFRVNAAWLAGKPDVVFTKIRLAIFIDGDFWHGWKFDQWSHKLAPYWYEKIAGNMARDLRHMTLLRRDGWTVMRIWEHDVKKNLERCIQRIEARVDKLRRA
ncbi:very short patch repair endonuclease [Dyella terrae]|uniref:very short patch repair endonuclease n=1 Tax=Dyella terrae TaxID=522259 RepID=UPI001EFCE9EA|nr:very short patch repair endonuclease [Dyella terrae]